MNHNIENMSASEIGRRYAPDDIKDRAGWGRKLVARAKKAGQSVASILGWSPETQADVTARAFGSMIGTDAHHYKAPHAYRGTPRRTPSRVRQPRFFIDGAQETRITLPR